MQKVVCDTSVGFSIGFVTKNVQRLFEQKVFLDKAFVAVMDVAAVSVANVGVAVVMPAVAATLNGAVVVAMASDDIVVAATDTPEASTITYVSRELTDEEKAAILADAISKNTLESA